MNIFIKTFGCKVNQYESEKMKSNINKSNHKVVKNVENSDYIIINSCIVTEKGENKNLDLIGLYKKKFPEKKIIVSGCLVEKLCPEKADFCIKNKNKIEKILDILDINQINMIDKFENQTRAYIKIQDGCNQYCSYCIIPYVRGDEKDKDLNTIINEAALLAEKGHKEIVLTGIHLGKFNDLHILLDKLAEIKKIKRIRLSSIQVNDVTDKIISRMKNEKKIMPHLHLSLQSGSTKILKKMNRPYTKKYFIQRVLNIRKIIPDIGITTDVITGFPTETETDFKDTIDVIKKLDIHRVHVFPYSARKNTAAFNMKGHIDENTKNIRAKKIRKLANEIFSKFVKKSKSNKHRVLVESIKNNSGYGYTENYLRCKINDDIISCNEIVDVRIKDYNKNKKLVIGEVFK